MSSYNDGSDMEKLRKALTTLTGNLSSVDDVMAAFGLLHMPAAQRYGIMFGFVVFTGTICAVLGLLVFGGSFARIAEQAQSGDTTIPDPVKARSDRALLLEHLLEARERMMKENYDAPTTTTGCTKLMTMLLNLYIQTDGDVSELANEDKAKRNKQQRFVPPGYQNDYVEAYRKAQDVAIGSTMAGRPEARFEAYARAFAGCGPLLHRDYRRSYARLYQNFSCKTHATDDKFTQLYKDRPQDIVGRLVRLEALDMDLHAQELFNLTSGEAYRKSKAYDPSEVWGFLPYGPFASVKELTASPIFHRKLNQAAFAMIENVTDRMMGIVILSHDDPENLTVTLDPPIINPSAEGTTEVIEACFLLLDKLFAIGYRRISFCVDSQDAISKKLGARLGFSKEAEIPKHMVVKDSNRDSVLYGLINSEWTKGCRSFLFKKLHGASMLKFDLTNNKKESELDDQTEKLAAKRAQEAAEEAAEEAKEASSNKK